MKWYGLYAEKHDLIYQPNMFFQSIQGFQPQNKEHRILNIIKGNVPSKIVASRDSKELVTTS